MPYRADHAAAKKAEWNAAHPEKVREAQRKWREANPEKARKAIDAWRLRNTDRYRQRQREWASNNPDKKRAHGRRHDAKPERKKPRGDYKSRHDRYRAKHVERVRARRRAYQAKRRQDPAQRAVDSIRRRMRHVIRGKSKGAFKLLGYTADELRARLETQFLSGMNWDNYGLYGDKWHVDHIKPVSAFNLPDQLIECFALENLQPLWAIDNLTKHAKQ